MFVRFADGASGRLCLAPEDSAGALAPLKDPAFFARVFVDHGAVAWPGAVDLAPDAMHREIVGAAARR